MVKKSTLSLYKLCQNGSTVDSFPKKTIAFGEEECYNKFIEMEENSAQFRKYGPHQTICLMLEFKNLIIIWGYRLQLLFLVTGAFFVKSEKLERREKEIYLETKAKTRRELEYA